MKRINNLEFGKSSYLGPEPDNPGWEIRVYKPNQYYGNESDFIKKGTKYYLKDPAYSYFSIDESCFKRPEYCFTITSWEWIHNEYVLMFVDDRPLDLTDEEWLDFKELLKFGFEYLKTNE